MEQPFKTVTFAIKDEDYDDWQNYISKIYRFIRAERGVPYLLIEKFISITHTPEQLNIWLYDENVISISKKAEAYFSQKKDYNYYGKTGNIILKMDPPPDEDENIEDYRRRMAGREPEFEYYSIKDMCLQCLAAYYNNKPLVLKKRNAIRFFYTEVNSYSKAFSEAHKNSFSHYQKTVIATFLANELGLIIPAMENLPNEKLFDRGKNDVKDLKDAD